MNNDEIESKYWIEQVGHSTLLSRFKASINRVIDAINYVYVLGDGNCIRLREEKFKGSKTYYLTYKQGESRLPKIMLRMEDDNQIKEETFVALQSLLPTPTFSYETTRHEWDGHNHEKFQLDKYRFSDGPFYLYEMEIEIEDLSMQDEVEKRVESLLNSLKIRFFKGYLSKHDRYKAALNGDNTANAVFDGR